MNVLYIDRPKNTSYYRVLESLWEFNLLKLNDNEEGEEYEYIASSIVKNMPPHISDDNSFAIFIKAQFNFWCGYRIPCKTISDFLPLAQDIKKIFEQ